MKMYEKELYFEKNAIEVQKNFDETYFVFLTICFDNYRFHLCFYEEEGWEYRGFEHLEREKMCGFCKRKEQVWCNPLDVYGEEMKERLLHTKKVKEFINKQRTKLLVTYGINIK
jgi:hypothetical protein